MVEPGSPSRIALVADDDSLIRQVITVALASDGWTVRPTADVAAELETLQREPVVLCIMDRRMPGASLEVRLRRVRRLRPSAAIVVLSGEEGDVPDDRIVSLGKPVEVEDLRDGIDRAMALIGPPSSGRHG